MPRNPLKALCQIPGCCSWAMRGSLRCRTDVLIRAHRDGELGPRAAGAPMGNLNALQHGEYLNPLSAQEVESLAGRMLDRPDELPQQVALLLRSVYARTGDPFLTLVFLRCLLPGLVNWIAGSLFAAELEAFLGPLPPPARRRAQGIVDHYIGRCGPEQQLLILRKIKRSRNN